MTTAMPVVLLGSSGHAREVAWIVNSDATAKLLGCVGPRGDPKDGRHPATWLGEDEWLDSAPPDVGYVIGIGEGSLRERLDVRGGASGRPALVFVHPHAVVGPLVTLGGGSIVWPGAVLTTDITVGRHVHVTTNAAVGHDAILDDYATLLPGCTVGGFSHIGKNATIGAGASVLEGIRVGAEAMVGAGALVREDIAPGSVVVGVPARPIRSKL